MVNERLKTPIRFFLLSKGMAREAVCVSHGSVCSNSCVFFHSRTSSKLEDGAQRCVSLSRCEFSRTAAKLTRQTVVRLLSSSQLVQSCTHLQCHNGNGTFVASFRLSRTNRKSQKLVGRLKKDVLPIVAANDRPTNNPPVFVLNEKPERRLTIEKPEGRVESRPARRHEDAQEGNDSAPLTCDPDHRSGYVALVGKPNVGKSTLMNQIIGQKLSIVTSKPQTTRHRILGICSAPNYQMVLYDTPGLMLKRMHKLDEIMMQNVRTAAINADSVLVVVDATDVPREVDDILEGGAKTIVESRPTLLVLNKKDMLKPGEIAKKLEWYQQFGGVSEVIAVSAKFGQGIEDLKSWLVSKLPSGPAYYPKDHVSDLPEKFFAAEIVREKIFLQYLKEIPYVCQVNVINYIERSPPAKDFLEIEIIVERDSQKAIVIGKDGSALKILSTAARLDIEDFVGRQVYIEMKVNVKENWRKNEDLLKYYGYSGQLRR